MSLFITFEGGEGSGKSFQAKLLAEFLVKSGYEVIQTREPGGTDLAEDIRRILLTGDPNKIDPITESLMYLAARADHWSKKIKPALDNGKVVISDRFHDSTVVYQCACKGVDESFVDKVFEKITDRQKPDRTYLLDIPPEIGLARSFARQNNDEVRFEKMDIAFHKKVRQSFLNLASLEKDRFLVIDGTLPISAIHQIICSDIKKNLGIN